MFAIVNHRNSATEVLDQNVSIMGVIPRNRKSGEDLFLPELLYAKFKDGERELDTVAGVLTPAQHIYNRRQQ